MPDIDLKPKKVQFWDHKTNRWQTRLSKTFSRNYGLGCLGVLAFVFWHRNEVPADILFGLTALFAIVAGIMLQHWLEDWY